MKTRKVTDPIFNVTPGEWVVVEVRHHGNSRADVEHYAAEVTGEYGERILVSRRGGDVVCTVTPDQIVAVGASKREALAYVLAVFLEGFVP